MNPYYPNNVVIRQYSFIDQNGVLYNPSSATFAVEDASGVNQVTLTLSQVTNVSTGVYQLNYQIPASPAVGVWKITVNAVYAAENLNTTASFSFNVYAQP